MILFSKFVSYFENLAKRQTLLQLRSLPEKQLIDCGFSPDLLKQGVKAWPWREVPEEYVAPAFLQSSYTDSACKNIRTTPTTETPDAKTVLDAA